MASPDDTAAEDLELYGEPQPEEQKSAVDPAANPAVNEPILGNDKPEDDIVPASSKPAAPAPSSDVKAELPAVEKGEFALVTAEEVASKPKPPSKELMKTEKTKEDEGGKLAASDVKGKEKEGHNVGSEDEDEDEDEDEEDDDDDEEDTDGDDDDFDVIVNCEDADLAAKPGNPSSGSIGKVRLPSNKWQRAGYVPPERVVGATAQGAARAGGVLAMLPTPTMQIGGNQKSVYDLEIGKLTEKPWLDRNSDLSDYFNYGFNEDTWKLYCERQKQMRLEASMLAKIKTVDGNKNQGGISNRSAGQIAQKSMQGPQIGNRGQPNAGVQSRSGVLPKIPQQPPQPPPGMLPPPMMGNPSGGMIPVPGMKIPNGGGLPNLPPNLRPNMPPFPFPPGGPDGKGGAFQPHFPFPHMPGGQRGGDGKNADMYPPFLAGMPLPPGMPMPPGGMPPGGMPPQGMGRGGVNPRGFPGQMQKPPKMQQHSNKGGKGSPNRQNHQDNVHSGDHKRQSGQNHQGSRAGNGQGDHNRGSQDRQGHHDSDRRRWKDNRNQDRRQGYDRQGSDRGGGGGGGQGYGSSDRGRSNYGDRGYGDRSHDRRRWNDGQDEGQDRRRSGGYDGQRYSERRDYDRDRERDYRKRSSSGRDFDDDRKRSRR